MLSAIWNIWLELSPWLLLGAMAAGLMHVIVPSSWMKKHLTGQLGVLKAVAIGVPLPLCSCGVIPVGLGLQKDGASKGAAVGFLISTPQTGVDSVLVSGSMLGWPFAILKVAVALVTGVIGGLVANFGESTATESTHTSPTASKPQLGFWKPVFNHSLEVIESIWRWLLLGVLISAFITWLIPEQSLHSIPLLTGFSALLVTLLFSLPLYVCATASVPIAAALVSAGLPTGAALVFLMAGPATNVATLGAVYRSLGGRALTTYLSTIVFGSLIAGICFNQLIPSQVTHSMTHDHTTAWWRIASGVTLAGLMLWFAVSDLQAWRRRRTTIHGSTSRTIAVSGMTCNGCAMKLEKALSGLPELDSVSVSFDAGTARIGGNVRHEDVVRVVESAGFVAGQEVSTAVPVTSE